MEINDVIMEWNDDCKKRIDIDDGMRYGLGFFETILVKDRAVFLREHVERINGSLETFDIEKRLTEELVQDIIREHGIRNEALKIVVTERNIIASRRDLSYGKEYYERGADIAVSSIVRSSASFLVGHKSMNYGDMILSLRNAKKKGYDDCLFLNEDGCITETAIANIFIVKKGKIHTPSLDCGLLPGVVRRYIIENHDVRESHLTLEDLYCCDGAFLTNSLVGVIRVNSILGRRIPESAIVNDISNEYVDHMGR
ncbi:4-amino-4-deoxychorismate lyase [Dethiosulfatibacter aminovorans DSM 17477]|uniref:4-amino-4-deoxychorismate lyase n=1 Tax=Dethiosulfatibacter aminovorans DSM 17477 TaxID=1121476 RepID=A0A1M6GQ61_9FIRM|nr:aminotransferase class IV [Dethiosulfatibacter aminovorans]SHJ12093.1 4-amino-4-deoxychorismate lyase [Dethiosulfatibacter aminovorans DSM 17477]